MNLLGRFNYVKVGRNHHVVFNPFDEKIPVPRIATGLTFEEAKDIMMELNSALEGTDNYEEGDENVS